MNLRAHRLTLVLTLGLVAAALAPATAQGSPIDDKRAEAARLQAEIDANGTKISALSEQYNGARIRLDQATAAADEAQTRIDAAQAETDHVKSLLAGRAADLYKGAGSSDPLAAVDVHDVAEFATRSKYASAAANHDSALIDKLARSREELSTQKQQYDSTKQAARAERDRLATSKHAIESANSKQGQLLGQTKGELATLVQQEENRRRTAATRRAQEITTPRSGRDGNPGADPHLPPPSSGAAAAIAFARAQLGKPYEFAATGPNSYDCSGLTMRAWEAGGVSMAHYSGAQYAAFPHVPLDAMQPGDLVFWGPGGSQHVGLYIGGGMMIDAPQTGDVVHIVPLYSNPIGAARPG